MHPDHGRAHYALRQPTTHADLRHQEHAALQGPAEGVRIHPGDAPAVLRQRLLAARSRSSRVRMISSAFAALRKRATLARAASNASVERWLRKCTPRWMLA